MGVKIVWHICQNCLTKVLTLWTFLLDKIWLSKLAVIFVKIVLENCLTQVLTVWHFCQRKYRCQYCLTCLSKFSNTCFDAYDTFVRQSIAVKNVWYFCQNCLTHVFHFWHFYQTLLSDTFLAWILLSNKILLSKSSVY